MTSIAALSKHSPLGPRCLVAAATLLGGLTSYAPAQDGANDPANFAWQAGALRHAQQMRSYFDRDSGQQATPPVIPQFGVDFDSSGLIATAQPGGPTATARSAFF